MSENSDFASHVVRRKFHFRLIKFDYEISKHTWFSRYFPSRDIDDQEKFKERTSIGFS